MKTKMGKLLKSKEPFAVVQYFEWLRFSKENTNKKYELHYLEDGILLYKNLSKKEHEVFIENIDKFTLVINNSDGKVYEFNNFKQVYEESKKSKRIKYSS